MDSKLKEISTRWDLLADERFTTLKNKEDQTYEHILKPAIIDYVGRTKRINILDVGCGLGFMTREISKFAQVVAIDISKRSLSLASLHNNAPNIKYINSSIEDFRTENEFDLVSSNMALMNMPNLKIALNKIYGLMRPEGSFIFTISHPSFWPIYWKYSEDAGFMYNSSIEITTEFKIRNKTYENCLTSHFHRPISNYLNLAIAAGFIFEEMSELFDEKQELWYPRFLFLSFRKPKVLS